MLGMGEPMKCSQCNGTGQSFAQDDCFAEHGLVICWQCGGTGKVWPSVGGEIVREVGINAAELAALMSTMAFMAGPLRVIIQTAIPQPEQKESE